MRIFWLCSPVAAFVAISACAGGSSAPEGAGVVCVPAGAPTDSCAATVQCVNADTTCTCTSFGGFTCTGVDHTPRVALPASAPTGGTCCDAEGWICGGFDTCAPICRCEHGAWSCWEPDCPLFYCPDPVSQAEGQLCDDRIGDTCMDGVQGCTDVCTCALDSSLGHGVWSCTGEQCSFDGGAP